MNEQNYLISENVCDMNYQIIYQSEANELTAIENEKNEKLFQMKNISDVQSKNVEDSLVKFFTDDFDNDISETNNNFKKSKKCSSKEMLKFLKTIENFKLKLSENNSIQKNKFDKNKSLNKRSKCKEKNFDTLNETNGKDRIWPALSMNKQTFNVGDIVWGAFSNQEFWPGKIIIRELHGFDNMVFEKII